VLVLMVAGLTGIAEVAMSADAGDRLDAIYYLNHQDLGAITEVLAPFLGADRIGSHGRFFSSWGRAMTPMGTLKPCAHYLTRLDPSFGRAFIQRSAIPLFASPALAAVLGTMLLSMGRESEIWLQTGKPAKPQAQWVRSEFFAEMLPSVKVETGFGQHKEWTRLRWGDGLARDIAALRCIYPAVVSRFDEFGEVIAKAGHPCSDFETNFYDSAENAFTYSMHWALDTAAIMDNIFRKFGMEQPMRGLDVGGSYGFLACELAAHGHSMTNLELIDWRVTKVQPWLAEICGLASKVDGFSERMENLRGEEGSYDFICFMGSLLCCKREKVPDVLRTAHRLLKPGGLIVLRENLLLEETKRTDGGSEDRFLPSEFRTFLEADAEAVSYFDHHGHERAATDVERLWTVYAAAKRPGKWMTGGAPQPCRHEAKSTIGYFFTTVTHGADSLTKAQAVTERIVGDIGQAKSFVASPSFDYAGALDPGINELSLLTPLPDEALAGTMIMPPVRYFKDGYGKAFLVHIYNAVRRGGWIVVPFHRDKAAERSGFWSLDWLAELLGKPERIVDNEQAAVFRRADPLHPPRSVLSFFMRDGHGFAMDFFKDRVFASTREYLDRCQDFLLPPLMPLVEEAQDANVDLSIDLPKFISNMNYSVTGAGYKTEGLRRLIDKYVPRKDALSVVDIGGGVGFVDVELLLSSKSVARLVNCEPLATNLPLIRRMYRWFQHELEGRYKVCPSSAQNYPFEDSCDVVCAFASLLYIPREHLEPTLKRAWKALRSGGILLIHENIKRPCFERKEYYDQMFTVESLEAQLARFGKIDYFRSSDVQPMPREQVTDLTVFRVVQKQ
jgi:SAM-dependent methyltransferase